MKDALERYDRAATAFTATVRGVDADAWEKPAPCEGWVARDVVRHLVEWVPGMMLQRRGLPVPEIPSVENDPLGAWAAIDGALRAGLSDPEVAAGTDDVGLGPKTFAEAVDMFCTPDVLVHTWDLARATGQDESLDPDLVSTILKGMEPMDAAIRGSGQFGPRVEVSPDADDQTRLIAFTGRTP